ncbi:MAG TPA: Xaa-Pro aminopeptidase [Myxococcales bacterium]|nr:Xaa-Pro aminopeptidase [Myxococcales bacterium]
MNLPAIGNDERAKRRQKLSELVDNPIVLMGNDLQPRNLPMVSLPFRQDSSFLYFTGCDTPGAAALSIDGVWTLFVPRPSADDALWHGPSLTLTQQAQALGFDQVRPSDELEAAVASGLRQGSISTLAVADESRNRLASWWSNTPLRFGEHFGDPDLVAAIIAMRRVKSPAEQAQLALAARHSAAAHVAVAQAAKPGVSEGQLAALFHGVLSVRGCVPGYGTILTRRGEVLHQRGHGGIVEAGDLLLVDGGGEVSSGYTADITRTWPIGGPLRGRARAAYQAVLDAQMAAIEQCKVGVRFRDVHDTACRILAEFLISEGLLTCSVDEALQSGAHAVFFPHGVGHHLGLDVHDLENFGDRSSYPADRDRPSLFGTKYLRLDLPLEAGWVVTVEPGLYAVPEIVYDAELRVRLADRVNWSAAEAWIGLGGIRIEDNIVVTSEGPHNLTAETPKHLEEIEPLIGSGPSIEERLGVRW